MYPAPRSADKPPTLFVGERSSAERLALAAAGEKKARKRNPAEAAKKLKKRAESQPSVARCVGRRLWYKH